LYFLPEVLDVTVATEYWAQRLELLVDVLQHPGHANDCGSERLEG